eukprot:9097079-Pyramimonas_sp.AAC.1
MCRGTCLVWKYGNQCRVGRLAVQCMLEKLEGYQLRYHTAVPKAGRASRKTAEWEAKDKGCTYIRDKGPRSNNANQFMEFADRESCRPESPIFGWEESRVERSLSNYAKGRANAKGHDLGSDAARLRPLVPEQRGQAHSGFDPEVFRRGVDRQNA